MINYFYEHFNQLNLELVCRFNNNYIIMNKIARLEKNFFFQEKKKGSKLTSALLHTHTHTHTLAVTIPITYCPPTLTHIYNLHSLHHERARFFFFFYWLGKFQLHWLAGRPRLNFRMTKK